MGNGHVATVAYSDTVFMNGLYNGNGTDSRRARIPAMTAINIQSISPNGTYMQYILDMKKGFSLILMELFLIEIVCTSLMLCLKTLFVVLEKYLFHA